MNFLVTIRLEFRVLDSSINNILTLRLKDFDIKITNIVDITLSYLPLVQVAHHHLVD
jgi:hypothetical protein